MTAPRAQRGFTLVELVMVILIAAILAMGAVSYISHSVGGYVDTARRQELAEAGGLALERIARELRNALPNSIRILEADGGVIDGACIEFIPILAGSTYVDVPIAAAADSFQAVAYHPTRDVNGRVAVYPVSTAALYAQTNPGPVSTSDQALLPAGSGQVTLTLDTAHQFLADSPRRRFFMVDSPVAYCQKGSRLFRYQGHGFIPALADLKAELPISGPRRRLVLDKLQPNSLNWDYSPASLVRNAVVRVSMVLVDDRAPSEPLAFEHEVQIRNVP